jgi:4-phosphopantoate--beta-alanine ligase
MIDPQHPRADSLKVRDKIVWGVERGITSMHGLIAQGRGEAFDYLIGEKTYVFAEEAVEAAVVLLKISKYPVLSVNGNSAVLAGQEYVEIAELLDCPIEVNLFHRTNEREKAIQKYLERFGAKRVLGVGGEDLVEVGGIASERRFVSSEGISKADVVFVPLEDGDRTERLIEAGKRVITIDLNPLSRTARKATVTIVDNIVRAMPSLVAKIKEYRNIDRETLKLILDKYDNKKVLEEAIAKIRSCER